jgi:hypothetical protein
MHSKVKYIVKISIGLCLYYPESIHTHMSVHVYMRAHVHVCKYMYVYICLCIYVYVYLYIYVIDNILITCCATQEEYFHFSYLPSVLRIVHDFGNTWNS